jgi:hypothetical protein
MAIHDNEAIFLTQEEQEIFLTLLHIVKIPTFYLRRYGQNCPYCRKIEEIYKKKNSCCPITSLLRR